MPIRIELLDERAGILQNRAPAWNGFVRRKSGPRNVERSESRHDIGDVALPFLPVTRNCSERNVGRQTMAANRADALRGLPKIRAGLQAHTKMREFLLSP